MKCETKNRLLIILSILLLVIACAIGYYAYREKNNYAILKTNEYNESFGNVVNYMNNVESLLAKSMISRSAEYSAETLTEVWKDSNLALVYLSGMPMNTEELSRNS